MSDLEELRAELEAAEDARLLAQIAWLTADDECCAVKTEAAKDAAWEVRGAFCAAGAKVKELEEKIAELEEKP
jgi:hypothetical protein